jgi:hypothetical protein
MKPATRPPFNGTSSPSRTSEKPSILPTPREGCGTGSRCDASTPLTHADVAELFQALGGKVSVNVARGDGPSAKLVQPVLEREFYGKRNDKSDVRSP